MWKVAAFVLAAALFIALAIVVLPVPFMGGAEAAYSYSDLAFGPKLCGEIARAFLLFGFLPSLAVAAAFVGLFPDWRALRVTLPVLAALALIGWASLFWVFSRKYPDVPIASLRWSLIAAAPVGIVAANAFMFLLARSRRPAAPVS